MRQRWLSRRALVFHLLLAIIVPGCLFAGWWQVYRALSGNFLSWAYSIEWPVFAIIAVVGWWQMIHEDPAEVQARREERARRASEPTLALARQLEKAQAANEVEPEAEAGEPEPSAPKALEPAPADSHGGKIPEPSLAAYNAYLATLAAGGRQKSLRNPRGLPPSNKPGPNEPQSNEPQPNEPEPNVRATR